MCAAVLCCSLSASNLSCSLDLMLAHVFYHAQRLWTCEKRPANDYYSFTNFAHKCNSSEGIRVPLPSDSRCVCVSAFTLCVWLFCCANLGLCVIPAAKIRVSACLALAEEAYTLIFAAGDNLPFSKDFSFIYVPLCCCSCSCSCSQDK